MKRFILCIVLCCSQAMAQHQHGKDTDLPADMFTGLGDIHHPVSTKNAQAQNFFDEGLALLYGFNHAEAAKAFQKAAQLDGDMAMAYWGIALVNGLNYNAPEFPEGLKVAKENLAKAQSLAGMASPSEQAYIAALTKRYGEDASPEKREHAYSEAMKGVMESNIDDLDAATLYAESVMNLSPWQLWSKDGKPGPDTERVIAILESVLRRNPKHIGANHYYIHAVEASKDPQRALIEADRLRDLKLTAGHLVHMPAHIYWRTGDYVSAADSNVIAAQADHDYIVHTGTKVGLYPVFYYAHNIHFQALADAMAGRYTRARTAADTLVANVTPALKDLPPVAMFLPVPTYVMVRFHKWDEILKLQEPDKGLGLHHAMWHWARGMAHAAQGDVMAANIDMKNFETVRQNAPEEAMVDKNSLVTVLELAGHVLEARIAQARKDYDAAQKNFLMAAQIHDNFNYIEPPEWPFPVYESMGSMLLAGGRAAEAEKAFRNDLERNPRNGRSLFGLMQSLKSQRKNDAARQVEMEFKEAWKNADTHLSLGDL